MKSPLIFLSLIVVTSTKGILPWLEHHLLSCPFKSFVGIDCPGCGLQRSVLALMRGDLAASFRFYPATVPIIGLFLFTIIHLKFDVKNGAFVIKMLYIVITFMIIVNYIYKIINHQLI